MNEIMVDGINANLAPIVQKVCNAIHRINLSPLDSTIGFLNTYHWIVIYPVGSAIQRLNNLGLELRKLEPTH